MLQEIIVDLGGRVAEELIFEDVTTGASQDIKQATSHDTQAKDTTVQALPAIIEHYKNLGYTFKGIDDATYAPHQSVNN